MAETAALKSVSGLNQGSLKFIKAKQLAEENITGVVAEGIFDGIVTEDTKYGPKNNVRVKDSEGNLLIVNQAGNLDYRMNQALQQGLKVGQPIQISYLGKTKMTKGPFAGTMSHSFDVAIESAE